MGRLCVGTDGKGLWIAETVVLSGRGSNGKAVYVPAVGTGIGRMRAPADLADLHFKLYLMEKGPAIGGLGPQLDEPPPTSSDAMSTLPSRMAEYGDHTKLGTLMHGGPKVSRAGWEPLKCARGENLRECGGGGGFANPEKV